MPKKNKSFYEEVLKMERARTANYGMDIEEYIPPKCPACKRRNYDYVLRDRTGKVIGCDECVIKEYGWDGE